MQLSCTKRDQPLAVSFGVVLSPQRIAKYLARIKQMLLTKLRWRMSLVKQREIEDREEVAEAVWMTVTAAVHA